MQQREEKHLIQGNVVVQDGSFYLFSHTFERTNVDVQRSFVQLRVDLAKDSQKKEIRETYGSPSGIFWLSWLVTYARLKVFIVWIWLPGTRFGGGKVGRASKGINTNGLR